MSALYGVASNNNITILKIVIGGDCYRLGKIPQSYSEFNEIIHSRFKNKLPENFCFKYEDSDNDSINIESSSDYEAFQEFCSSELIRQIKLRVDSKSYKQYFNWYQPQQQSQQQQNQQASQTGQGLNVMGLQQSFQNNQLNGALGSIINPFSTSYQNVQCKSTSFTKSIQNYPPNITNFANTFQNPQTPFFDLAQMMTMSLLGSQGNVNSPLINSQKQGISGSGSAINSNNNNNNNYAGNISGNNINQQSNNTNPNQSLSLQCQTPILSKIASEVNNANDNPNSTFNAKRVSSANQSSIEQPLSQILSSQLQQNSGTQLPQPVLEGNISFANGRAKSITSNFGGNINNNIVSKGNEKNPTLFSLCSEKGEMNQTSRFMQFDSQNNQVNMDLEQVSNPMESDDLLGQKSSSMLNIPRKAEFKRIDSMNIVEEDTNHSTFQILEGQKSKDINLGGSNISQNIENRQASTACHSNYSNPTFALSSTPSGNGNLGNQGIGLSVSSNSLSRDLTTNPQPLFNKNLIGNGGGQNEFSENNVYGFIKRELSPSPPISYGGTLTNSAYINPSKLSIGRASQLVPTQRSGTNPQISCEACIIKSEEQKQNGQSKLSDLSSLNSGGRDGSYVPQPDCTFCAGTGFLIVEDSQTHNIIQAILRHKLKEAEGVLKGVTIKQQKIGRIVPKEIMDHLQNMLHFYPEIHSEKKLENNDEILKGLNSQICFDCKKDIDANKYSYLCIDCKMANEVEPQPDNSKKPECTTNLQNYILCEICEEKHEPSHQVVQMQYDDVMIVNSLPQNQGQSQLPQGQRGSILEKGPKNLLQSQNYQSPISFIQSNSLSASYSVPRNKGGITTLKSEQNNSGFSSSVNQQTISRLSDQQESQYSQTIRSRVENKSSTIIINQPSTDYITQFENSTNNFNPPLEMNHQQSVNFQFTDERMHYGQTGRVSSNLNIFKPLNQPLISQMSIKTAYFEDEPVTFNPANSQLFDLEEEIKQKKDERAKSALVLSPSSNQLNQILEQPEKLVHSPPPPQELSENKKLVDNEEELTLEKPFNFPNTQLYTEITEEITIENTTLISQQVNIGYNFTDSSICIKLPSVQTGQSLTSSFIGQRSSLVKTLAPSKYKAKFQLNLSSEILVDDCIVVFQEIINNGQENWPESVFLKCISGITEYNQFPITQVNKGETMKIAFSLKMPEIKPNEGEQVKTSWRLYYMQENEENQFFGPKTTIQFTYKKPQVVSEEETTDSILVSITDIMSKMFTEDDQLSIKSFIEANQDLTKEYLKNRKFQDVTISKLIIKFIEKYVDFHIQKQQQGEAHN